MWRLKQKRIWVAWNYRLVDGRLTKKPISIYGTPTGTDEAYSHTWATYDEAVAAKEKYGFSGIGFVVPKGYFFLDIDHMDLSDPFVQLLMERFATYVERSVSGKGLHLYGMCDLSKLPTYTDEKGILRLSKDFYTKHPHNRLELYVGGLTNRYAVYTGDTVNDVEFNECTSAILTTLDKDMRKKPKTNYSEKRDGDDRGIFDVVCSLRKQKNGEKFCKLYDNDDDAVAQLLLEFIGVCISNIKGWRMKKALFLVGDGDTGKSQLKSLVELLLGKGNFIGIDLKEIEARFGTGAIYGTRLAGSSDMSFLSVDELKTFKKITGGDSLFAEFKGQQGFEYTYNGVLWFCMNRLPKFGGDDGQWVYDRIMVVRCPNVIPKDQQDKKLLDKLYAERDGIVFKAVQALRCVIENGYRYSEPESVAQARDAYMAENNTVISFYEECMCERPGGRITDCCTTGKVYDVYRAWCADNNNGYAKTAKEFRETLARHLGSTYKEITVHTDKGTCYRMHTLTDETKEQYHRVYGCDFL